MGKKSANYNKKIWNVNIYSLKVFASLTIIFNLLINNRYSFVMCFVLDHIIQAWAYLVWSPKIIQF